MEQRKHFKILDLQPTHIPKRSTLAYYGSLSQEQLQKMPKPQVWASDLGPIISDGNNYIFYHLRTGSQEIEADYVEIPLQYSYLLESAILDAEIFRSYGIRSPKDLCKFMYCSIFP
jgi:hypothetical protein